MPNRIFIIEDDDATRYAYTRALEAAGFQTADFRDYFAAALQIDQGAGALLVVDLQLPAGTPQGSSVALMARNHRPGLPIIFVTSYLDLAKLVDAEIGRILLKPIDLEELVELVRDLLPASPTVPV